MDKKLGIINDKIQKNNKEVTRCEIVLKQVEDLKDEIEDLEDKRQVANLISKVVEKDGLQDQILTKNIIPKIECEVNEILKIISSFQIEIKYLKKTLQVYKIVNTKYRVLKFSGYEQIALNLAFRLTFCSLENNKFNGLFLDELFSFCDYDTLQNINKLFDFIRQRFDFTIIISHNDDIKKFCDMSFDIERINGMSRLRIGNKLDEPKAGNFLQELKNGAKFDSDSDSDSSSECSESGSEESSDEDDTKYKCTKCKKWIDSKQYDKKLKSCAGCKEKCKNGKK